MDPFTPNDPLWKLMSKARPGVPCTDFTQNVVRAARQQAQDSGWWPQVREWLVGWQRPLAVGASAAAVAVAVICLSGHQGGTSSAPVVAVVSAPVMQAGDAEMADLADEDFSIPLDSLDHMDALVAREDTSSLTDAEIQFLLY